MRSVSADGAARPADGTGRIQGASAFGMSTPARRTVGWSAALYLLLTCALAGWLHPGVLVLAVPLVYVRLALSLHETLHRYRPDQLGVWLRLAAVLDTPLALGYREHRILHLLHHRYSGAAGDPERPLIDNPAALAFLHALVVPERSFLQWVRERGIDGRLARETALRALLFAVALAVEPAVFLVYLVALRLSIGTAGFVFHHLLHARQGRIGTYALPGGPRVFHLGCLLFGSQPMRILARHRAHHLWPRCDLESLPDLPDDLELPAGRAGPGVRRAAAQAASSRHRSPACAA